MLFAWWLVAGGVFGAWTGMVAIKRNRSGVAWWTLGVVTGPVGLALLYSKPKRSGERTAIL